MLCSCGNEMRIVNGKSVIANGNTPDKPTVLKWVQTLLCDKCKKTQIMPNELPFEEEN